MSRKRKEEEKASHKLEIVDAFQKLDETGKSKQKKNEIHIKNDVSDTIVEMIKKQLKKDYDPDVEARIIINPEKGDFEVYLMKEVVEEVDMPLIQIDLKTAKKIDEDIEEGDIYEEGPVDLSMLLSRKSIQIIKQSIQKKIRDFQRTQVFSDSKELEGKVVTGEFYQNAGRDTIFTFNTLKENKIELILTAPEKMLRDNFYARKECKLYVQRVERQKMKVKLEDGTEIEKEREDGAVKVFVSRIDDNLLRKLFENEVPEVGEGLIVMKSVARVPGERAKIAVESTIGRIDPVGACVGHRGSRIKGIVKELNNENIDVIPYSDEIQIYIARALMPAKIDPIDIAVDYKARKSRVIVKPEQIKFAIGRNGNNIYLAEKLTGMEIEIMRHIDKDTQDPNDIDILAFREDFGDDIVYRLVDGGLDTANKIHQTSDEDVKNILMNSSKEKTQQQPLRPFKGFIEEDGKYWFKTAQEIKRTVAQELEAHQLEEEEGKKEKENANTEE